MPIYITQGRYTRDAIKGMIAARDLAPGFKAAGGI